MATGNGQRRNCSIFSGFLCSWPTIGGLEATPLARAGQRAAHFKPRLAAASFVSESGLGDVRRAGPIAPDVPAGASSSSFSSTAVEWSRELAGSGLPGCLPVAAAVEAQRRRAPTTHSRSGAIHHLRRPLAALPLHADHSSPTRQLCGGPTKSAGRRCERPPSLASFA